MNITVMYGGQTGEHEVSLLSASSIVRSIDPVKHSVTLIAIDKKGVWYLQDESEVQRIRTDKKAVLQVSCSAPQKVFVLPGGGTAEGLCTIQSGKPLYIHTDIVFPVLHGTYGEDGTIQGLFEMASIPYCGCGVAASALSMDKEKTKQIWLEEMLPVVPYITVHKYETAQSDVFEQILMRAEREFTFPVFVKPCSAGSSVGASKAVSRESLINAVNEALLWDEKALIEPFISAREIECSVTGNETAVTYVPGEIVPSHEFYDYDAKYIDPDGAALVIPARLDAKQEKSIRELAEQAYKAVDASGFARIDFFIDKKTGRIYLNEINTIPGFTSISMFAKLCEASGLAYSDLVELILSLGIERSKMRRSLKTSV